MVRIISLASFGITADEARGLDGWPPAVIHAEPVKLAAIPARRKKIKEASLANSLHNYLIKRVSGGKPIKRKESR